MQSNRGFSSSTQGKSSMGRTTPSGKNNLPSTVPCYQPMEGIVSPHHNDVLCGRGVTTNRHPGNENFRGFVNRNKALYVTSTKRQKMTISRSIVEAVRNLDPPGRFLEKDVNTGLWSDIGDKKAVEKTSQALRDGAASLRKLLSDDLNDPDVMGAVFDDPNSPDAKLIMAKRKALQFQQQQQKAKASADKANAASTKINVDNNTSPSKVTQNLQNQTQIVSPGPSDASPSQHPMVSSSGYDEGHHHHPQYHHPYGDDHHHNYSENGWAASQQPYKYSYNRSNYYGRSHDSPPRHRMEGYHDMDISPPPSPRIEPNYSSRDRHNDGNEYWNAMNMSKDNTSNLFRELKHQASTSMSRSYHKSTSAPIPSSSRQRRNDYRFPSPPKSRDISANFVEVTQEGYYHCSSSRGTRLTGRFRGDGGSQYHYDPSQHTPDYHRSYSMGNHHNGLVTPSPTRKGFRASSHGSAFNDTKKYFEPPPPRSSYMRMDPNMNHDNYMNHYNSSYHPHHTNHNIATPPPGSKKDFYNEHPPSHQYHPPNDFFDKDQFFPDEYPGINNNRSFTEKSYDTKPSDSAWLRESPLMFEGLPMETTQTRCDNSSHGSHHSMKSDVTPLPYRTSPTTAFSSPFLGYLCCGPSFCDGPSQMDNCHAWSKPKTSENNGNASGSNSSQQQPQSKCVQPQESK